MKKVFLSGNHSKCHCGSEAVWKVLKREIESHDTEIASTLEDSDALILNGEGSMHHSSKTFLKKIELIDNAQKLGKETYLVNSVWMKNPSTYDKILYDIDSIICREIASCRDLIVNHSVSSLLAPDLSFFKLSKSEREAIINTKKEEHNIGITDFYYEKFNAWSKITGGNKMASYKYIDLTTKNWKETVEYVSKFKLIITGRFHAMCACMVARTPFIAIKSNSHKIEGLIESTHADIPHADEPRDIYKLIEPVLDSEYTQQFQKAFDWPNKYKITDALPERIFY